MATTTYVAQDLPLVEAEVARDAHHRFSWSATLAGATAAVATTLFLLMLGAGIGLGLTSPDRAPRPIMFLTLGGIYFMAAQAFGFAVGGHIAGRLIGPQIETRQEEDFRAGVHGLVLWALAVVTSVVLITISSFVAANSTVNVGSLYGLAPLSDARGGLPATVDYWTDVLFRPAQQAEQHASVEGVQYAQADTGTASDANTAAPGANPPADEAAPSDNPNTTAPTVETDRPARRPPAFIRASPGASTSELDVAPSTLPPVQNNGRDLRADKAEVGRILLVGLGDGGYLSTDDRDRIAQLVAQDAGVSYETATMRANDVQSRIHNEEIRAAERARKITSYASLWIAFSLLFGAVVATVAAVSARWEDDAQSMFPFLARSGETRFS